MSLTKLKFIVDWEPHATQRADLDAVVFMLAADKWIPTESHIVYHGNAASTDGAVIHQGDDRNGLKGEIIEIDLSKVGKEIEEIILAVCVFGAEPQTIKTFGETPHAIAALYDAESNTEIKRIDLKEGYVNDNSMEFGRLFFRFNKWRFESLEVGYLGGLEKFVNKYVY